MSINSAIASGVSGLIANSSALSAISDNIANSNTVGYKQNNTEFSDLVTGSSTPGNYTAGGVTALTSQLVTQQGGTEQTTSNTDLSISGSGMFVVTNTADPTSTDARSYTRAGSFTVDSQGYLQNAAGFYLSGWPVNADGSVTADPSNLNALETINVGDVGGTATPTTQVSINANLDSSQTISTQQAAANATTTVTGGVPSSVDLDPTAAASVTADDPATVTVKDANGNVVYTESDDSLTSPYTWNGTSNTATPATITDGNYTVSITNSTGSIMAGAYNPVSNNMASGTVTPDATIDIPISDSLGGQESMKLLLMKTSDPNTWDAELVVDPASNVQYGSDATLNNGQVAVGTIKFNASNGTIDLADSSLFGGSTTPGIALGASSSTPTGNEVAWASKLGIDAQNISFNLSEAPGGITQLNSASLTQSIDENGTQFGSLDSVSIDQDGFVTATYSNGVSKKIAQVAVATFENPDGLKAISGDAYQVSSTSGSYNLKTPGTGGAGTISSSTLESSTVDLSTQFSDLITTQTAYSASSKVITTADQMLQSLISIIQ